MLGIGKTSESTTDHIRSGGLQRPSTECVWSGYHWWGVCVCTHACVCVCVCVVCGLVCVHVCVYFCMHVSVCVLMLCVLLVYSGRMTGATVLSYLSVLISACSYH